MDTKGQTQKKKKRTREENIFLYYYNFKFDITAIKAISRVQEQLCPSLLTWSGEFHFDDLLNRLR